MIKLQVKKLKPGMKVAKDIVTKRGQTISKAGTELTSPLIARLSFYKIDNVYVEEDFSTSNEKTETKPAADLETKNNEEKKKDEPVEKSVVENKYSYSQKLKQSPVFQEFQINYSKNITLLEDEFKSIINGIPDSDTYNKLLNAAITLFASKTSIEMFDLLHSTRSLDDSVYAHSVNVALIARAIGKWSKFSRDDLNALTVAGLVHDIGKTQIPDEILNKPGRYTKEELALVQQHPTIGKKLLRNSSLDDRIKSAVLQHHERQDGSGYPRGLEDDEISDFASIIAIADVYDAMTAARSYRAPKCAFQVIAAFEEDGLQKYNTKYILTFLEHIASAYQNSRVMLSNAECARIIYINKHALSHPIVQTDDEQIIDLSKEKELYIQSIL